jgi:hypothetical protein
LIWPHVALALEGFCFEFIEDIQNNMMIVLPFYPEDRSNTFLPNFGASQLHAITSEKTAVFIVTAIRTSYLTPQRLAV